ncbi:hypothetical protein HK101_003333 [Irineochytrium annulatum]|nr:hypothetical protein HK101_003333 [Irineochytrium annulatum]
MSSFLPSYTGGGGGGGGYGYDKYRRGSWYALINRYIRAIINDPKTKNVFFFLLLNIVFTAVEFLYGWWTNSLGLISDAVHMLFDSTALILSLYASVVVKWEATEAFSYGYGRVETLTGFANALALVFASLGIIWEGLERLMDPPEVKMDNLLTVSILGFLVNIVGIFAFDHGGMGHNHSHGGGGDDGHGHGGHGGYDVRSLDSISFDNDHGHAHSGHDDHGHGHGGRGGHGGHGGAGNGHAGHAHATHAATSSGQNPLLHGMFLHVLADTLGSVGVIISSILIRLWGWNWADPVASLFIAAFTLVSIWPLLVESSCILLQRIPAVLKGRTAEAYRRLQLIDGVVGFSQAHFWEVCQGKNVGSIKIQVRKDVDSLDRVRVHVIRLFREFGIGDMCVQIEQDALGY